MLCWLFEKDTNVESESLHLLEKIHHLLEEKNADNKVMISTLELINEQLKGINNNLKTLNDHYRLTHLWDLA